MNKEKLIVKIETMIEEMISEDNLLIDYNDELVRNGINLKKLIHKTEIEKDMNVKIDFDYELMINEAMFKEVNELKQFKAHLEPNRLILQEIISKKYELDSEALNEDWKENIFSNMNVNESEDDDDNLIKEAQKDNINGILQQNEEKTEEERIEIERKYNLLLEKFETDILENLKEDIKKLVEKHFGELRENDGLTLKEKIKNFKNDWNAKRAKRFTYKEVDFCIRNTYKTKNRDYKNKRNLFTQKAFGYKGGLTASDAIIFFKYRSRFTDFKKKYNQLVIDMDSVLEEVIEEAYIECLKDEIQLVNQMKKKDLEMDIEVDKYLLMNYVWREIKYIFTKNHLDQKEFKQH